MWVNNETGAIQPIGAVVEACRRAGVRAHSDAVQALGHVPVLVRRLGAGRADPVGAQGRRPGRRRGAGGAPGRPAGRGQPRRRAGAPAAFGHRCRSRWPPGSPRRRRNAWRRSGRRRAAAGAGLRAAGWPGLAGASRASGSTGRRARCQPGDLPRHGGRRRAPTTSCCCWTPRASTAPPGRPAPPASTSPARWCWRWGWGRRTPPRRCVSRSATRTTAADVDAVLAAWPDAVARARGARPPARPGETACDLTCARARHRRPDPSSTASTPTTGEAGTARHVHRRRVDPRREVDRSRAAPRVHRVHLLGRCLGRGPGLGPRTLAGRAGGRAPRAARVDSPLVEVLVS